MLRLILIVVSRNIWQPDPKPSQSALQASVQQASDQLIAARTALNQSFATYAEQNNARLTGQRLRAEDAGLARLEKDADALIADNNNRINQLDAERASLLAAQVNPQADIMSVVGMNPPLPDPALSDLSTSVGDTGLTQANYWTTISTVVSAQYDAAQMSSATDAYSTGGTDIWGLFGVGGKSGSSTQSQAASQLANSTVKVSFECMRVNIARAWLHPVLFYDDDLQCAPNT